MTVLMIRERSGSWAGRPPRASLHNSREEAETALREYVLGNWESEIGTDPPEDPEEAVSEYFSDVLESYDIAEAGSEC